MGPGQSTGDRNGYNRRRWLALCGGVGVAGIAGCLETSLGTDDEDSPESTDDGDSPESTDDGDTPEPTDDEDPRAPDFVSFAYEIELQYLTSGVETNISIEGYATSENDHYARYENPWVVTEVFLVDDVSYELVDDWCEARERMVTIPGELSGTFFYAYPYNAEYATADHEEIGQEEVDGEETTVYELQRSIEHDGETYTDHGIGYVSDDTGYLLRYEFRRYDGDDELVQDHTLRYHSHDEEFTVTIPEEC